MKSESLIYAVVLVVWVVVLFDLGSLFLLILDRVSYLKCLKFDRKGGKDALEASV